MYDAVYTHKDSSADKHNICEEAAWLTEPCGLGLERATVCVYCRQIRMAQYEA